MKQLVTLEHYFFPEISVIANPEWLPENAGKGPPHANITSECNAIVDKENTYQVILNISIESTDEHPSQYIVKLMAYGILKANEDLHDKKNNMSVTGASILYSASREFLLGIMSRGPWAPIMLHAMSFNISRPDPTTNVKTAENSSKKTTTRKAIK